MTGKSEQRRPLGNRLHQPTGAPWPPPPDMATGESGIWPEDAHREYLAEADWAGETPDTGNSGALILALAVGVSALCIGITLGIFIGGKLS